MYDLFPNMNLHDVSQSVNFINQMPTTKITPSNNPWICRHGLGHYQNCIVESMKQAHDHRLH